MITIKCEITEQENGSVLTQVHSCDLGTTKECVFGMAICEAIEIAAKLIADRTGGKQKTVHKKRKIAQIGKG